MSYMKSVFDIPAGWSPNTSRGTPCRRGFPSPPPSPAFSDRLALVSGSPGRKVATDDEIAALRRDPVGVPVMIVDAEPDAFARLRIAVVAQCDDGISRVFHPADAVELEHRMPAWSAGHDLGAEAGFLVDFRQRAELGVPGVDRHVAWLRRSGFPARGKWYRRSRRARPWRRRPRPSGVGAWRSHPDYQGNRPAKAHAAMPPSTRS